MSNLSHNSKKLFVNKGINWKFSSALIANAFYLMGCKKQKGTYSSDEFQVLLRIILAIFQGNWLATQL